MYIDTANQKKFSYIHFSLPIRWLPVRNWNTWQLWVNPTPAFAWRSTKTSTLSCKQGSGFAWNTLSTFWVSRKSGNENFGDLVRIEMLVIVWPCWHEVSITGCTKFIAGIVEKGEVFYGVESALSLWCLWSWQRKRARSVVQQWKQRVCGPKRNQIEVKSLSHLATDKTSLDWTECCSVKTHQTLACRHAKRTRTAPDVTDFWLRIGILSGVPVR